MKDEFYYFKGRVTILVDTIPKYTQYQLSQMVKAEVEKENLGIGEISLKYNVDQNLLNDILLEQVKFKAKHYEVVSSILGLSVSELLADEEIKPISFRSKHEESDQDINREIVNVK
ncbi:hypothetical protein M3210_19735 [Oceanobacillus luteolus]|uniref:hypothetical protein n=1 Tax=Oceanobacillus luteolus TaxID=1274358 RepID=UPI00203EB22E|nr:hypothetical protein [Oceanobacillus luteolus]MCM3742428.1 hypothetical protein [Oceanobacillus luteolus]